VARKEPREFTEAFTRDARAFSEFTAGTTAPWSTSFRWDFIFHPAAQT
jgi:hypothetical protein